MALARCSWQLSPLSSLAKSGFFVGLWVLVKGWQCSLLNHHSNFPSPTEQSKTAVCAGKNSHAGLFQLADDEQLTSGWLRFFFILVNCPCPSPCPCPSLNSSPHLVFSFWLQQYFVLILFWQFLHISFSFFSRVFSCIFHYIQWQA